jgi:nickel-dependent lactate racemase
VGLITDVWLPYGKTEVCARIPTRNYLGSIKPRDLGGVVDAKAEIEKALTQPIGTKRLSEIARESDKVTIVVDDATRATPSSLMLAPVLGELNRAGVTDENVTIIVGCGLHRSVKQDEIANIVGKEVLRRVKVESHDCESKKSRYLGRTSFGTKVYVNPVYAEADVKVLCGDINLHYYAGYGGGRKSILPAITSVESIQHNHAMLFHSKATTGVLKGNPVHEDMMEAANLAEVDFILNVVTNSKHEVVKAFAGDVEQAFYEGVKLVDEMYKVPIERRADIVVVSAGGHPLDINLYQAYKGIDNALKAVKRKGVIVLVAECPEGHGNKKFLEWMRDLNDLKRMEKEIKKKFVLGGHKAYYLTKALQRVKVVLVSVMPDYYVTNIFKLGPARTMNDALQEAFAFAGKNAKVWAMPFGNNTLPIVKPS